MGLSPFKNCGSYPVSRPPARRRARKVEAPAPNPDPRRWTLLRVHRRKRAYVLVVRYHDCTNFEGVKVMVYRGRFPGIEALTSLDPHFADDASSPIARFRPDAEGLIMALELAERLG